MIRLSFKRAHPIDKYGDIILNGDFRELRQILTELQTARKFGYAKSISDVDISREIIRIDQEGMR